MMTTLRASVLLWMYLQIISIKTKQGEKVEHKQDAYRLIISSAKYYFAVN